MGRLGLRQCPKCGRFSVEYDYVRWILKCLWRDCGWDELCAAVKESEHE